MPAVLAFPVFLQHAHDGRSSTAAMDWFVVINLAFLLFMLGFFACWAWLILRRTTRPEPHIQLLMELEEELSRTPPEPEKEKAGEAPAEWEREPDWWRK